MLQNFSKRSGQLVMGQRLRHRVSLPRANVLTDRKVACTHYARKYLRLRASAGLAHPGQLGRRARLTTRSSPSTRKHRAAASLCVSADRARVSRGRARCVQTRAESAARPEEGLTYSDRLAPAQRRRPRHFSARRRTQRIYIPVMVALCEAVHRGVACVGQQQRDEAEGAVRRCELCSDKNHALKSTQGRAWL